MLQLSINLLQFPQPSKLFAINSSFSFLQSRCHFIIVSFKKCFYCCFTNFKPFWKSRWIDFFKKTLIMMASNIFKFFEEIHAFQIKIHNHCNHSHSNKIHEKDSKRIHFWINKSTLGLQMESFYWYYGDNIDMPWENGLISEICRCFHCFFRQVPNQKYFRAGNVFWN